jgi:tripeptide aminopeptidase
MDRDRMVEEFTHLIRIDSPGLRERHVALAVEAMLRGMGVTPYYDRAGDAIGGDCGNLIARLPATAAGLPTVLINAHLDTVAPSEGICPVISGDTMHSGGDTILAADNKAGVVILLEVVRALVSSSAPRGEVIALFTVAEEIGLLGAMHLDYNDIRADVAYVMDGGRGIGRMTTAAPYANRMAYTVRGKAAHAGVCPEQGINAIVAAGIGVAKMRLGRLDEETTANIGVIHGGTATNIVPAEVHVRGEARSHDLAKLLAQTEHMAGCMQESAEAIGAQVEIDAGRSYDGFAVPDDSSVVRWASQAATSLGFEPATDRGGGGSDANVFNAHGIPAVIMSTGASGAHALEEQLCITEMVDSARWLFKTVETAQGGRR